ncbi:hypothetical protein NPIL_463511 [Nephila pilipes]|uniref:Uncharacterized protein n=1 Tax=Nephila pilipes TaxID=299642 RepID=A0A8X6QK73_NEPPI|nr:hypothetical protein NPIL_463511 [Nephila pilipes]
MQNISSGKLSALADGISPCTLDMHFDTKGPSLAWVAEMKRFRLIPFFPPKDLPTGSRTPPELEKGGRVFEKLIRDGSSEAWRRPPFGWVPGFNRSTAPGGLWSEALSLKSGFRRRDLEWDEYCVTHT